MGEGDTLPEPMGIPDYIGLAPETKGALIKLASETGQYVKAGDAVTVTSQHSGRAKQQIHDYDLLIINLPSQEVELHLCPDGTVDFKQTIQQEGRVTTSIDYQQEAQGNKIVRDNIELHFSSENTPDLAAALGNGVASFEGSLFRVRQEDQTTYVGSIILELTNGETLIWDWTKESEEQEIKKENYYKSEPDDDPNPISEAELPRSFLEFNFHVDTEERNGEDVPVLRLETDETMLEAFVGGVIPRAFDNLPLLDRTHSSPQPLCRFAMSVRKKQK